MKKSRIGIGVLVLLLIVTAVGCGKSQKEKGSVYYLNFKPEVADVWEEIAETYTAETGVDRKSVV